MKMHILAMRDIVANVFGQPFFTPSIGGAIRSFGDLINNPEKKDVVSQHPEHFELWHIGSYDDEDGTIDNFYDREDGFQPQRRQLASGANLVINK